MSYFTTSTSLPRGGVFIYDSGRYFVFKGGAYLPPSKVEPITTTKKGLSLVLHRNEVIDYRAVIRQIMADSDISVSIKHHVYEHDGYIYIFNIYPKW